jgi:hypothetical protein
MHIPSTGIIAGPAAACCFAFFQYNLPYHLFFKEQIQLFLLTEGYFLSYLDKPAWLACYAGDFLTQFFYLRGGGSSTLTAVLLAEYLLAAHVLRRLGCRRYASLLALLPAAADGFLHCGLYYGLPASLAIILALSAFLAFTTIFYKPSTRARKVPVTALEESPKAPEESPTTLEESPTVPEESPKAPEESPKAPEESPKALEESPKAPEESPTALEESPHGTGGCPPQQQRMSLAEQNRRPCEGEYFSDKQEEMTGSAFPSLSVIAKSAAMKQSRGARMAGLLRCFAPRNDDYSCRFRLFIRRISELPMTNIAPIVAGLLLPCLYSVAGAAFFLFPVLLAVYLWQRGGRQWLYGVALAALAAVYPAAVAPCYLQTAGQACRYPFPASVDMRGADTERETILALAVEAGRGNWGEVSRRAEEGLPPNPVATYFANIASSVQGRLPETLLSRYQPFDGGLFLPVNPQSDRMSIFFSNEVFYHLGDMNMAKHSAMLGMIFSPRSRSVRIARRLAEINLATGDTAVARKYLRMLEATLFHRRRAERLREMPLQRRQITSRDTLRTASDYAVSLKLLIESAPEERYATDYLLCYYLLNKDIPAFAGAFGRYRKADGYLPRLYAEALLIKLAAEKASAQEVQSYGIPAGVITDFMDYTRLYEQYGGSAGPLRERFGRGYWFYYHFARLTAKEDKR